jgi:hypothetical protein
VNLPIENGHARVLCLRMCSYRTVQTNVCSLLVTVDILQLAEYDENISQVHSKSLAVQAVDGRYPALIQALPASRGDVTGKGAASTQYTRLYQPDSTPTNSTKFTNTKLMTFKAQYFSFFLATVAKLE